MSTKNITCLVKKFYCQTDGGLNIPFEAEIFINQNGYQKSISIIPTDINVFSRYIFVNSFNVIYVTQDDNKFLLPVVLQNNLLLSCGEPVPL